jgi:hypothetical protein
MRWYLFFYSPADATPSLAPCTTLLSSLLFAVEAVEQSADAGGSVLAGLVDYAGDEE